MKNIQGKYYLQAHYKKDSNELNDALRDFDGSTRILVEKVINNLQFLFRGVEYKL